MRICHIITRFVRGGADENTLLTCNGQAEAGHEVFLVYGPEFRPGMVNRVHPNITGVCLPSLWRDISYKDLQCLGDMLKLLRKIKPDVVHTHTSKAGVIGRLAAKLAGTPIIVHGVHILPFDNVGSVQRMVYLGLEHAAAYCTDAFIHVSDGMRDKCLQAGVGTNKHHFVVPSGMDMRLYQSASRPADMSKLLPSNAAATLSDKNKIVLMAGAFEKRKRTNEFVSVFARIAERVPDSVLLIAGEGPLQPKIESRIAELGLSDRVFCIGFRQDLHELIALADVCVHAACREGLPRVVIQYAIAGKPIVAAELPGIEAVVKNGETGFLTDSDDLNEMEAAVVELLSNETLRTSFSKNALALDFRAWDAREMVQRIERIYFDLAEDKNMGTPCGEPLGVISDKRFSKLLSGTEAGEGT